MLFSQQWFDGAEKRCGTSVTPENTDRQVMSAHVKGAVVDLYFFRYGIFAGGALYARER